MPAPHGQHQAAASPLSLRAELARKGIHLASAIVPLAWAFGWWEAATVRGLLSAALAVALAVEGLRRRVPAISRIFLRTVGPLLRGAEHRGLSGATTLALAMTFVAILVPAPAAIIALWAAAVGDASAAIVGRSLQAARGTSGGKTVIGSLTLAATTAAGALWLGGALPWMAILLGLVAAAAERSHGPLDDNLRVATATALAAVLLGLR